MSGGWELLAQTGQGRVWYREEQKTAEVLCTGHMDTLSVPLITQRFDRLLDAHGRGGAFFDWEDATSYDPGVRRSWMAWLEARGSRVESIHFLTRSRLISMGIQVANLAWLRGKFEVHASRASYLTARGRLLRAISPPSIPPGPRG